MSLTCFYKYENVFFFPLLSGHISKPGRENYPHTVRRMKSSMQTGAEILLIAVQSVRAHQERLQSPKYPQTGPGCPGRLSRPCPALSQPRCAPHRPHQPPVSPFNLNRKILCYYVMIRHLLI